MYGYSWTLGVRTDKISPLPDSWLAIGGPNLEHRVCVYGDGTGGVVEAAFLANGGSYKNWRPGIDYCKK